MDKEKFLEKYTEDFLEFLPLAICILDSEGYIVKVNQKMEELLDYKKHQLVDEKLDKIFNEQDIKKILSGGVREEEVEVKGKEETIPVNLFADKKIGDKEMFFVALSDLSRAKEIEKEMEEKVKELERFNRLATGRELRMVELKRDKKKLKGKIEKLEKKIEKLKEKSAKKSNKQENEQNRSN